MTNKQSKAPSKRPPAPSNGPLPRDVLGESALFDAAREGTGFPPETSSRRKGDRHVRAALLEPGSGGLSCVLLAASVGNIAFLRDVVGRGHAKALLERGLRGDTPAHMAARHNHPEALALCLPEKTFHIGNLNGFTPVHEAAENGADCLKTLLKIDSVRREVASGSLLNRWGSDPLFSAARSGCGRAVAALVAAGADPNSRNEAGDTPLCMAAGKEEAVKALLESGADPSSDHRSGHGPLWRAASSGCKTLFRAAILAGADPFLPASGASPAALAALNLDTEDLLIAIERASPVGNEADSVFQRAASSKRDPEGKMAALVGRGILPRDVRPLPPEWPAYANSSRDPSVVSMSPPDKNAEDDFGSFHRDDMSREVRSPLPLCASRGFSKSLRTLLDMAKKGIFKPSHDTLFLAWLESLKGGVASNVRAVEEACREILGESPRNRFFFPAKTTVPETREVLDKVLDRLSKNRTCARAVLGDDCDRLLVGAMEATLSERALACGEGSDTFKNPGRNIVWNSPAFLRGIASDPSHRLFGPLSDKSFPWAAQFCALAVRMLARNPEKPISTHLLETSGIASAMSCNPDSHPKAKNHSSHLSGLPKDSGIVRLADEVADSCAAMANHDLAETLASMGADPSLRDPESFWKSLLYSKPDTLTPRSVRTWRLQKTVETVLSIPGASERLFSTGLAGMCEDPWTASFIAERLSSMGEAEAPAAKPVAVALGRLGSGRITPASLSSMIAMSGGPASLSGTRIPMREGDGWSSSDRTVERTPLSAAARSLSKRQSASPDFPGWLCLEAIIPMCDPEAGDDPWSDPVSDAIASGNVRAAVLFHKTLSPKKERPWLSQAALSCVETVSQRLSRADECVMAQAARGLSLAGVLDPWAALDDGTDPLACMLSCPKPQASSVMEILEAGHPADRAYPFKTVAERFPHAAGRIASAFGTPPSSVGAGAICLASRMGRQDMSTVVSALFRMCPDDGFRLVSFPDGSVRDASAICRHDDIRAILEGLSMESALLRGPSPSAVSASL